MTGRFQLTARRSIVLAVFLLAALALGFVFFREPHAPPESDTDARIAFYSARLGGRGTYPAYARLGAAYLQKARETGDAKFYPLAEKHLRQSNEYQANFEAIRSLAALSLDLHRFAEAADYAQQAVNTIPADLESLGLLFDAQLAVGRLNGAEAVLDKMSYPVRENIRGIGAIFVVFARRANLQELRGDLRGALGSIEQACQDTQSLHSQAWCQVRLGSLKLLANCDAAGAEAAYHRALALLPNYFLAQEHLAELYAAQEKYEEAERSYRRLIEALDNPSHRLALAEVLLARGQNATAADQFSAAYKNLQAERDNGDRQHLLEFASLLLDLPGPHGKQAREALIIAQDEIKIRRDVFALDALAWAQFHNDQKQEALASIEEALREGTKNSGVLLHAAEIFNAAGRKERATQLLSEVERCPAALTPGERATLQRLKSPLPN